jgi:hypothetical protein
VTDALTERQHPQVHDFAVQSRRNT